MISRLTSRLLNDFSGTKTKLLFCDKVDSTCQRSTLRVSEYGQRPVNSFHWSWYCVFPAVCSWPLCPERFAVQFYGLLGQRLPGWVCKLGVPDNYTGCTLLRFHGKFSTLSLIRQSCCFWEHETCVRQAKHQYVYKYIRGLLWAQSWNDWPRFTGEGGLVLATCQTSPEFRTQWTNWMQQTASERYALTWMLEI